MRALILGCALPLAASLPFLTSRAGGAGLELAALAAQHNGKAEPDGRTAATTNAAATATAASAATATATAKDAGALHDDSKAHARRDGHLDSVARMAKLPHRSLIADAFDLMSSPSPEHENMELAVEHLDRLLAQAVKDPDALEERLEDEELQSHDDAEEAAIRFVKAVNDHRHDRVEDPYATSRSPDPLGHEEAEAPFDLQNDVLQVVFSARKNGGHRQLQALMKSEPHGLKDGSKGIAGSATGSNWYFVVMVIATLLCLDVCVLQHLPETTRTHLLLLIFWILLGFAIGGEMWVRTGALHGTLWLEGFLLECTFGIDRALVWLFVLLSLGTPRRLMGKALTIGLLGSVAIRWVYLCGLPTLPVLVTIVPYLLGLWLVYAGARLVAAKDDDASDCDVTQSLLVRAARATLGSRLGEFYDEDGEGLFVQVKGRYCLSLLGVVIVGIIGFDSLISMDVALLKMERVPNGFLDISSAAIGGLIVRAGFFVVRDVVNIFGLEKYCLGTIFFFLGAELLLGRAVYISAALSTGLVILILALSAGISWLRAGPHFKFLT